MSNGELSENNLIEDDIDNAYLALSRKIRKNTKGRYSGTSLKKDLVEIPNAKFGKSWYFTNYDGYNIYTDSEGNYIDADYNLGKIKVATTSSNIITLTNTMDKKKEPEHTFQSQMYSDKMQIIYIELQRLLLKVMK